MTLLVQILPKSRNKTHQPSSNLQTYSFSQQYLLSMSYVRIVPGTLLSWDSQKGGFPVKAETDRCMALYVYGELMEVMNILPMLSVQVDLAVHVG